jgi:predicted glycoside hydrolase/deacetylase ChbG (UPF0249 family)
MANAAAFDDAIKLVGSTAQLSIGCHIVLVDGVPVLDRQNLTLINKETPGRFYQNLSSFASRVIRGRIDAAEIEAEAVAQIRKVQAAGIAVSHLDTHKHTHIFPQVLQSLLRAARTCGVPAIRNPFGPLHFSIVAKRPSLWNRHVQVTLLSFLAKNFRASVAKAGMRTPDGTVGIVATGALDDRLFERIVECLPEGTWELVCHPGYNDSDLASIHTRLRASREIELQLLTSPANRELLARYGVELVSYHGLT